jgi:4-carboxymuconolactone decarboxylase
MSRIPLARIEHQPEPIQDFVARRGDLDVFRLLANAPQVFAGWSQLVDELFDSTTFSLRMKEVVILRVAHLQGSRYELSRHVDIARAAGVTDGQINAITDLGDLNTVGFSEAEHVAVDLVTELCSTFRLGDDTFATASEMFGAEPLTELLMIVSCYYGLALVLNAVDLDAD